MTGELLLEVIDRRIARQAVPAAGFAEVTTVGPLTVTFPGDSAAVPMSALAGYVPTVGDTAVLVRVGSRWVAVGSLA